jgi:hypothetical protein
MLLLFPSPLEDFDNVFYFSYYLDVLMNVILLVMLNLMS